MFNSGDLIDKDSLIILSGFLFYFIIQYSYIRLKKSEFETFIMDDTSKFKSNISIVIIFSIISSFILFMIGYKDFEIDNKTQIFGLFIGFFIIFSIITQFTMFLDWLLVPKLYYYFIVDNKKIIIKKKLEDNTILCINEEHSYLVFNDIYEKEIITEMKKDAYINKIYNSKSKSYTIITTSFIVLPILYILYLKIPNENIKVIFVLLFFILFLVVLLFIGNRNYYSKKIKKLNNIKNSIMLRKVTRQ